VPTREGSRPVTFEVVPLGSDQQLAGVTVSATDRQETRALRAQLDLVTRQLQSDAEQREVANEELRIANEQLQEANDRLEAQVEELKTAQEAIRHKDEFLAMLAHELRNPLAPILTAAHLLRVRSDEAETVQRAREIIERQVRHEARLLDVSRITRGMIDLQRRPVDLADIVAQAVETVGALVEERRHQLSIVQAPQPLPLHADPVRLVQVVSNLLVNAAKFTPPGGRLGLRTERDGATAVLRVTDNGVGIPPNMLDKIFGLFAQVEPSLARSQGGLGIGLTLAKTLVEMHGGTIVVASAGPGRGSEFVVRLPLGAPAPPKAAPGESPPRRYRILLIEDHHDARQTLGEALRLAGHEVFVADNGADGIDLALAHHPDVAVVDIGLPGVSGYEVAARVRAALGSTVRLIALTGYGQAEDRRRSQAAGFDAHVVKPVGVEDLEAMLQSGRDV
jgi:signal transduction histidine kinase/CheY-like chemotaxis protein